MLADIADESNRLLNISENLLLLTRLGSGSPPDLEPQLIAHVTPNGVDAYQQHHPQPPILLTFQPARSLVEAERGPPDRPPSHPHPAADPATPPGAWRLAGAPGGRRAGRARRSRRRTAPQAPSGCPPRRASGRRGAP